MTEKGRVPSKEVVRSIKRIVSDGRSVAGALDFNESKRGLRSVTHPNSPKGTMRKVGVALAIAPEPVTTVAGVALVAGSFLIQGNEPASVGDLKNEASKVLKEVLQVDLDGLSIDY